MADTPVTHLEESLKLSADAEVHLYEVTLKNTSTVIRFTQYPTITWQGNVYENIACRMSGEVQSADGQESKPTLTVLNPAGIFNTYIQNGSLDLAVVVRKTLLRKHLEANLAIFKPRMWYVSRLYDVISGQSFSAELRSMSEGPNFWIPARAYLSPTFPVVSL